MLIITIKFCKSVKQRNNNKKKILFALCSHQYFYSVAPLDSFGKSFTNDKKHFSLCLKIYRLYSRQLSYIKTKYKIIIKKFFFYINCVSFFEVDFAYAPASSIATALFRSILFINRHSLLKEASASSIATAFSYST